MFANIDMMYKFGTRLPTPGLDNRLVMAIINKIGLLSVLTGDMDSNLAAFLSRKQEPYSANPEITLFDQIPGMRLQIVVESIPQTIYSMFDVAARMLNLLDQRYKSSFRPIADQLRDKNVDYEALSARIDSVECYYRAREMRTEWTHHSASFVGLEEGTREPVVVLFAGRRPSERVQYKESTNFKLTDIKIIANQSLHLMDGLAAHVVYDLVLPRLDRSENFAQPKRDANGWPMIKDARFEVEETTVGNVLKELGISPPDKA